MKNKKQINGSAFIKLIVLVVIMGGIFVGYYLLRNRTLVLTDAITPKSIGYVEAVPGQMDNGLVPVDINFRTGNSESNDEAISAVTFRLRVDTKSGADLVITNQDGSAVLEIMPAVNLSENADWIFPVNKITADSGDAVFEVSFVNSGIAGYSTNTSQRMTTFYVKGAESADDLTFTFDEEVSSMFSKRRPVADIWEK